MKFLESHLGHRVGSSFGDRSDGLGRSTAYPSGIGPTGFNAGARLVPLGRRDAAPACDASQHPNDKC